MKKPLGIRFQLFPQVRAEIGGRTNGNNVHRIASSLESVGGKDVQTFGGFLTVNLLGSTLIFWAAARLYVVPNLARWESRSVLMPILLLHSFRHLGLMFLAPGAIYPGLPREFAVPAAFGDLAASVLAFASLIAVARKLRSARALTWAFNVEGTVDLISAITLATVHRAAPFMGPAYWIPAFWVPALLVAHYLVFRILLERPARW
jgi:hypothetical protein